MRGASLAAGALRRLLQSGTRSEAAALDRWPSPLSTATTSPWTSFLFSTASFCSSSSDAEQQPPPPPLPQSWDAPYAPLPPSRIRNFCIIAHVDHGKSTLADRLLERTGSVAADDVAGDRAQFLDGMDLERERGITIKLNSARMRYRSTSAFEGGEGGGGAGGGGGEGGEKGNKSSFETEYALNLIDTPGHVDFSYEVSRSLAACEGALLVVDASQGVEAQTLANVTMALEAGLEIVPVINKIDLPGADPERVRREIEDAVGGAGVDASGDSAILASAKRGIGIDRVLEAVVTRIPPPPDNRTKPLRALIFDSCYDAYRGVVVYFRVVDGSISRGDSIRLMASGKEFVVDSLGVLAPRKVAVERLSAGDVGFCSANIKAVADARVGDTITLSKKTAAAAAAAAAANATTANATTTATRPLPGYKEATPMVFCGLFPTDADAFPDLRDAMCKLQLSDAALRFEPEASSPAMGCGFRVGLNGLLHAEIVQERLEREFGLSLIRTAPTVAYKVKLHGKGKGKGNGGGGIDKKRVDEARRKKNNSNNNNNEEEEENNNDDPLLVTVDNPASIPDARDHIQEPYVRAEIICPADCVGAMMEAATARRGELVDMRFLGGGGGGGNGGGGGGDEKKHDDDDNNSNSNSNSAFSSASARASLSYDLPLAEVIADFFDELKSRSRGYASMDYSLTGYRKSDLVRLDVRVNGEVADALTTVAHRDAAYRVGRALCKRLKELIPRHQFQVPIQAAIGSRIIASESIAAFRKDTTSKCYGGDVSRKKKLLKKQAEGKKRMKSIGKVNVPQSAFLSVLDQRSGE